MLRAGGQEPAGGSTEYKEEKKAVEALIEAVGRHPRSLVLLGGLVAEWGVEAVTTDVRAAMAELEARFPDMRERSLIASVRVSLKRLPAGVRESLKPLAALRGPAHGGTIAHILQSEPEKVQRLCRALADVGLAEADSPYLFPDPGLGAALAAEMTPEEQREAEHRWLGAMLGFSTFLYDQRIQDAQITRDGTRIALADLIAALHTMEREATARPEVLEAAVQYATVVESLVSDLGFPAVLARIVRRSLADRVPAWGHARFQSLLHDVDRMCDANDLVGALQKVRSHCATLQRPQGTRTPKPTRIVRLVEPWSHARKKRASRRCHQSSGRDAKMVRKTGRYWKPSCRA